MKKIVIFIKYNFKNTFLIWTFSFITIKKYYCYDNNPYGNFYPGNFDIDDCLESKEVKFYINRIINSSMNNLDISYFAKPKSEINDILIKNKNYEKP